MKLKKVMVVMLVLLMSLSLVLTGCGSSNNQKPSDSSSKSESKAEETKVVLKYGTVRAKDHSIEIMADHYFDELEKKSGGRIKVESYYDSSLGSAREIAESVKEGTIDLMWGGSGDLSIYAPVAEILTNPPFLYKSPEHGEKVLKAVWPDVDKMLVEKGFKPLYHSYQGTRQWISKKPIRSFEDMQGLKKRTVESPYFMGLYKALGLDPSPIALNEFYTALQTGVVDAGGGDLMMIYTKKWQEQAKYVTLGNAIVVQGLMVMSDKKFNSLPKDLQDMMLETASGMASFGTTYVKQGEEEYMEKLKAEGVEIIELDDSEMAKFRNAVSDFAGEYAKELGDDVKALYDKMVTIE